MVPRRGPNSEAGVVAKFPQRLLNGQSPTILGDRNAEVDDDEAGAVQI